MKSLFATLAVIVLLAHLVTGSWYVKKCANKLGNCRKTCRNGELPTEPATGVCPQGKSCCVLSLKISGHCGGATEASGDSSAGAAGTGPTKAAATGIASSAAAASPTTATP